MSTDTHHGQTPEIIWAEVFANMYLSLPMVRMTFTS